MVNEQEIIKQAQQGDRNAFSGLVVKYQADLNHLARNLVSSADDAEDLTSEAFARAWRSIRHFRGESSFKTWLWRILINLCRSHLRRRYLTNRIFVLRDIFDRDDQRSIEREWVDYSTDGDPQKSLEQKNIRQVVQWARKKLSPREQEVFTLKYDKDMKITEIASLLKVSPNTVKVLLFRATNKLARELGDYK